MTFQVNKFISHFDSHAGFAKASKFDVRIEVPKSIQSAWNGNVVEALSLQCEAAELPGYTINTVDSQIYGAPMHMAATPAFGDISLDFICAGDMWEKQFFDYWLDFIIPKDNYNVQYKDAYQTKIRINQYSEYVDPGAGTPKNSFLSNLKKNGAVAGVSAARDFLESKVSQRFGSGVVADIARNSLGQGSQGLLDKITGKGGDSLPDLKPVVIYSVDLINAFPVTVQPLSLSWSGSDEVHKLKVTFKYDRWLGAEATAPDLSKPKDNQSLLDRLPKPLQGPLSGEIVGQLTSKLRF